jgi:hypothetical protein
MATFTFSGVQIAALLFSSSVLAALVSIGGNHLLAQLQFKRDYFKEIIAKRLRAYEQVDELIAMLRGTTYDDSSRIAHIVFLNKAIYDRATVLAATGVGLGLYLSEPIRETLSELNFILLKRPDNATEKQAFDVAAAHREQISALRQKMEYLVSADLLELYKVRRFLKQARKHAAKPTARFLAWLPKHGAFSFKNKEQ